LHQCPFHCTALLVVLDGEAVVVVTFAAVDGQTGVLGAGFVLSDGCRRDSGRRATANRSSPIAMVDVRITTGLERPQDRRAADADEQSGVGETRGRDGGSRSKKEGPTGKARQVVDPVVIDRPGDTYAVHVPQWR